MNKKWKIAAPKGGSVKPPAAGEDLETVTIMAYLGKKMAALPPIEPEAVERFMKPARIGWADTKRGGGALDQADDRTAAPR